MNLSFKRLLNNLGNYFGDVPESLRRKRFVIWAFCVVATVVISVGVPRLKINVGFDSWYPKDDPVKVALNQFQAQFGGDDLIYLAYKPKDGDLFSQETLKAVKGIREDLLNFRENLKEGETSMLGHITKIDSVVSAKVLKAKDDSLIAKEFIGDDFPLNKQDKENLRNEALTQNDFAPLYFSRDFKYGAIVIETDLGALPEKSAATAEEAFGSYEEDEFGGSEDEVSMEIDESLNKDAKFRVAEAEEYSDFVEAVNKVIYQKKYAERLEYYPVGTPVSMRVLLGQMIEMAPICGTTILIITILLWVFFRSLSFVLWPCLTVIISCVWTMGLSGWAGVEVTEMFSLTILLIFAVGIANSVHILSAYQTFLNNGAAHKEALKLSFQKTALPCFLACLTTIIGMMSITLSPLKPIAVFGYMSAMGVCFAYIFSIYLLPLMMDIWSSPPRGDKKRLLNASEWVVNGLGKVLPAVEKSPVFIILAFLVFFITCIYGTTQVRIDSNIVGSNKENSKIRISYKIADENLAGTQSMEIYIKAGAENAFQDPALLKTVDELQRKIEKKYSHLVGRSFSLANVAKDAYQVLNEGKKEYYVIPDDPNVLAQTMFMFNNANPEDRRRIVSDDYSKSRVSFQLYNDGSYNYTRFFKEVNRDIEAAFKDLKTAYPLMEISVTGGMAMIMRLADYITWSQTKSLWFVILTISVLMIFVFGSTKVGLFSIVPNMIPAIMTFGLLGLFGIAMDMDTIVVVPLIIGMAVDNTIHVITHYRQEVLKGGNIRSALENTIKEVGRAASFTTFMLGFGFWPLMFGSNLNLLKVGFFGSLAIFMALLCNLLLLPALITAFKLDFMTGKQKAERKNA